MADTAIEWTEKVWNPTTGCDRVSDGCDNCYAMTLAKRLKGMGQAKYQRDGDPRTSGPGFGLTEHVDALYTPMTWRKPQRIFVNSMSDLFHDEVSDEFIARVFATMALAPQHTYQVLTKRHGRMRSLLSGPAFEDSVRLKVRHYDESPVHWREVANWPLPNVWGGVSAEDQKRADLRLPALARTRLAVRWVSVEPMLGPIDLTPWLPQLDWVVVGGESGPRHRPFDPDWARSIRDQCAAHGVPFLFKQHGGRTPKAGGRELDGRTHDGYPATSDRTT